MNSIKSLLPALVAIFFNITFAQDSLNCRLLTKISNIHAYGLEVKNNYAFVASESFSVLDMQDIYNPKITSTDSLAPLINSVYVNDNYAYLAAENGLIILDISSYAKPTVTSYLKSDKYIQSVTVKNGYAYLGTLNHALLIADVSNPHSPSIKDSITQNIDDIWNLEIKDSLLFAASENSGVKIFSLKSPASPVELTQLSVDASVVGVKVKDNTAFISHPANLYAFDISDLSNPRQLGYLKSAGGSSVFIEGNYAYLNNYKQLRVVDISSPEQMKLVGYYPIPTTGTGIYVKDQVAYVTCQDNGLYLIKFDNVSGVENNNTLVKDFTLSQNYPNPFNPSTSISYNIPNPAFVSLKVYDMLGKEVAVLVNEEKPAGTYNVEFNAKNLASGIYFYKMQAGNFTITKKLTLLK
jgi:hypothetical protein